MNAQLCPRCGEPVLTVGKMTFDLQPGDREHGGRTVYAQYAIVDSEPLVLSGIALGAARQYGMKLYRRHGITCSGFWPRHRDGAA